MVDTKQTKTVGEMGVASELARRGWAPALTRDGLERTDILAVSTRGERQMIEVQVKAANGAGATVSWPLSEKSQLPSLTQHEWFVLVAISPDVSEPLRHFVVPRDHVAAAAWISHMNWLTEPGIPAGQRNAPVTRARVLLPVFASYENRWDLLGTPTDEVRVLLPSEYRDLAQDARVGLPDGHPWRESESLPSWG